MKDKLETKKQYLRNRDSKSLAKEMVKKFKKEYPRMNKILEDAYAKGSNVTVSDLVSKIYK